MRKLIPLLLLAMLAIAGCKVEENKNANNGQKDVNVQTPFGGIKVQEKDENADVKIQTPFGGMNVKTNDKVAGNQTGIPVYPGAAPLKKSDGGDDGAADVNMQFGKFRLKVKAITYASTDPLEKVKDYYRKSLGRYGDVIECRDHRAVGTPTQTREGLTCEEDGHPHVNVNDADKADLKLMAGSKSHQHVVALNPREDGTKITLVALDIPAEGEKQESN